MLPLFSYNRKNSDLIWYTCLHYLANRKNSDLIWYTCLHYFAIWYTCFRYMHQEVRLKSDFTHIGDKTITRYDIHASGICIKVRLKSDFTHIGKIQIKQLRDASIKTDAQFSIYPLHIISNANAQSSMDSYLYPFLADCRYGIRRTSAFNRIWLLHFRSIVAPRVVL